MKTNWFALASLSLIASCAVVEHDVTEGRSQDSAQAFDILKSLEGKWSGTAMMGETKVPVEVSYELVSAGSTVMERLFLGTPHEMVTMYHRDGDRLLLTHYCAAGNQPRMELESFSAAPEATLTFGFEDATNWKGESELIMHDARISKLGPDHIAATWTAWTGGKPDHSANFDLTRDGSPLRGLGYAK